MAYKKEYTIPEIKDLQLDSELEIIKKLESKNREKLLTVVKLFRDVDMKIEEYPELLERLFELSNVDLSHFVESVRMAEMAEQVALPDTNIKEMKKACLFHDIGKSGPQEANPRQRELIVQYIFNRQYFMPSPEKGMNMKQMTIKQAIEQQTFSEEIKSELLNYLPILKLHIFNEKTKEIEEQPLDLNKHQMIDLWREHDYWTYGLLKKCISQDIDRELVVVSSTHHALEGHYPQTLDGTYPAKILGDVPNTAVALELLDKYSLLTLIDKYEAYRERSNLNHVQAIAELERIIIQSNADGKINHDGKVKTKFLEQVKIIDEKFKE